MSNIKVLVIDDEQMIRENISTFLEDEGMNCLQAVDEGQTIEMIDGHPDIQVAIVDMRLSGVDGNSLIKKMHEINDSMKFIIHTGSQEYILPDELKAMGIEDKQIFKKPILDMMDMVEEIRRLCN